MAWCRQATSHYLNQCWPTSMWTYGTTGPQWVKPDQLMFACTLSWQLLGYSMPCEKSEKVVDPFWVVCPFWTKLSWIYTVINLHIQLTYQNKYRGASIHHAMMVASNQLYHHKWPKSLWASKKLETNMRHYLYEKMNGCNVICMCRQVSNISHTLVGNKIVDHSDVVGASPVGAAPTTSSFSTQHLASLDWAKVTVRRG